MNPSLYIKTQNWKSASSKCNRRTLFCTHNNKSLWELNSRNHRPTCWKPTNRASAMRTGSTPEPNFSIRNCPVIKVILVHGQGLLQPTGVKVITRRDENIMNPQPSRAAGGSSSLLFSQWGKGDIPYDARNYWTDLYIYIYICIVGPSIFSKWFLSD